MYDSFAAVTVGRVELARLSKATLSDLSHVLEDVLLESLMPGVVLTGFQVDGNWAAELTRYQRLVEPDGRTVAVFATGELGDTGEIIGFALPESSGLRQEWFIVVQAEQFSCALFGVDRPDRGVELPVDEMDRLFDATWTFDPVVIGELSQLVLQVARNSDAASSDRLDAALRRFPPRTPSREFEARFHQRMLVTLERGRQRWRDRVVREYLLRQQLQESEGKLLHLERLAALGTVVASLAHEINNPLGAISLASELVDSEVATLRAMIHEDVMQRSRVHLDAITSHNRLISQGSARVGRLARGMLDVARSHEIRLETVELVPWLKHLVEELAVSLAHPVVLLGAGNVRVSIDTDRVRHIITNLVRNAAEADRNGMPVDVEVEGPTRDRNRLVGHVTVLVRDHGSGVPGEVLERLFQPFVTTKLDRGGTGLGLVLGQRFAQECNGTLTLRSTNSSGSVFALTLPTFAGAVVRTSYNETDEADGAGDEPHLGLEGLPSAAQVALVLDDDPLIRATLGRLLTNLGWRVLLAESPDAAVRVLAGQPCDVMILDWGASTESFDFAELSERLESVRPGCTARMIVITGSLTSVLPDDFGPIVLFKPFGRNQLQAALTQLANR